MTQAPPPAHCITLEHGTFTSAGASSLLQDALASGATVPFSCQRGECGSCRAEVLEGDFERLTPAHERSYPVASSELLLCQCRALSDLRLRFPHWQPQAAPQRFTARVAARLPLSADVTRLVLTLPQQADFPHQPGQHVRLCLPDGQRRAFSIANLPQASDAASLELHIRRQAGGAFTDGLLPALREGDTLALEGPQGHCVWPRGSWPQGVDHLVLLATGTGFAGVFPILMAALQQRQTQHITLYWGGRESADCYAAERLDALQGKHTGLRWEAVLSGPAADSPAYVQQRALDGGHDWSRTMVFACGNPAMVQAARQQLSAAGLPHERFFSEAFLPGGPASPTPLHPWEQVGPAFTLDGILRARARSMRAVHEIAALIHPGMTTRQAITAADAHLRHMGSSHNWHPTYVRFGPDSQSPAVHPTDFQRRLGEKDLFVLDIGPVWDGYEGDYGDTFVLGRDATHLRCAAAAREVFRLTRLDWLEGLSGKALYARADHHARQQGCRLVHEIPGHRVAEFPHALYGKHQLAQAGFAPADGIWVLEIQVRDAVRPVGAFYEDVLLREPPP